MTNWDLRFLSMAQLFGAWGKDPAEAVYHAVVLERVAEVATKTETINHDVEPVPQELQDKHYERKHGPNAYYGQSSAGTAK